MLEEGEPVNVKKLAGIWNLRTERVRAFLTAYADLCPEFEKILKKKGWETYSRLNVTKPQEPAPAKKPAKKEPAPKAEAEVVEAEVEPSKEEAQPAPKPTKKRERKTDPLTGRAQEVFTECYEEIFNAPFCWGPSSIIGMSSLLEKIRFTIKKYNQEDTDDGVLTFLRMLLNKIADPWVMNHFSPEIINKQYNQLFSQVRNGNRSYKDLQRKREIAEIVRENLSEPYEAGDYGVDTPPPGFW